MPVAARTKRIVHQKAKGPVDPGVGRKVRELRAARGMTQAQLAGADFSKGFISLLETGRTRASLRAAEILAGRLGVDVTDLLSTPTSEDQDREFMLLRAEQTLRSGDTKAAIEIAAKWTPRASGVMRARFQRLHARALMATTRSPETVKLLEEALRTFRALGAKDQAARTLFDLARAHARLHAVGESIRYALEAEQAVHRGDLIDRTLELDIHQLLAGGYMYLGDMSSAQIRAERARALAEDIADPRAVAGTYEALALARFNEGDKEAALAYARKSLDLYDTLGHTEKVAESWNTLGWLFIRREQYGKAEEALDRSQRIAEQNGLTRLIPFITANRAVLALSRGDAATARTLAESSAAGAPADAGRLRARALLVRARALAADGAPLAEMKRAFNEAIAEHDEETSAERGRAHQFFSEALAARSQTSDALAEARKALDLLGLKL